MGLTQKKTRICESILQEVVIDQVAARVLIKRYNLLLQNELGEEEGITVTGCKSVIRKAKSKLANSYWFFDQLTTESNDEATEIARILTRLTKFLCTVRDNPYQPLTFACPRGIVDALSAGLLGCSLPEYAENRGLSDTLYHVEDRVFPHFDPYVQAPTEHGPSCSVYLWRSSPGQKVLNELRAKAAERYTQGCNAPKKLRHDLTRKFFGCEVFADATYKTVENFLLGVNVQMQLKTLNILSIALLGSRIEERLEEHVDNVDLWERPKKAEELEGSAENSHGCTPAAVRYYHGMRSEVLAERVLVHRAFSDVVLFSGVEYKDLAQMLAVLFSLMRKAKVHFLLLDPESDDVELLGNEAYDSAESVRSDILSTVELLGEVYAAWLSKGGDPNRLEVRYSQGELARAILIDPHNPRSASFIAPAMKGMPAVAVPFVEELNVPGSIALSYWPTLQRRWESARAAFD